MGHGIKVTCTNCGHAQQFYLGIGMLYDSLINVIDLLALPNRDELLNILQTRHVERVKYEHALFACPECRMLEKHFFYEIEYDQGEVLRSQYQCARCGQNLILAGDDIQGYRCPACGEVGLIQEFNALWD